MKDNRASKGFWSEFNISNWRKRTYERSIMKLLAKSLTKEGTIDYLQFTKEDELLYFHVLEANDIEDLKT